MNKVILTGRLTRDPELKQGNTAVTRFSLAVNRRFKRDGEPDADFFNCVSFGQAAETIAKYSNKGDMMGVSGRLQTGSYTNKDGNKVNTLDVVVEEFDFLTSKAEKSGTNNVSKNDGFMNIPDGIEEELPFF